MNIYFNKNDILINNEDIDVLITAISDRMSVPLDSIKLSSEKADGQTYQLILTYNSEDDSLVGDPLSIREDLMGVCLLCSESLSDEVAQSVFSMITSEDVNTKDLGLAIALRYQMSNHPDSKKIPAQIIGPKLESINHSSNFFKLYKILANSYYQSGILDYLDEIVDNEPENSLRYKYCMWAVGMPF